MTAIVDVLDRYWQYVQQRCPQVTPAQIEATIATAAATRWDEPETAIEFNNIAVLSLIEAEQCDDPLIRSMQLEMAIAALEEGEAVGHPLCAAHLAVIRRLTGDFTGAAQAAFGSLMNGLPAACINPSEPLGLVYLPPVAAESDVLLHLLQAVDGSMQAQQLLVEVLTRSQLAFYNSNGLRFLQLAAQLMPASFDVQLRLGLAKLNHHHWEGILHLQQAYQLAPSCPIVLQALWLVYQHQPETAQFWQQTAQAIATDDPAWHWANNSDDRFTTAPFDDLRLAIEPSFESKVTSVLLAEGDWFEAELEFWRDSLQAGMTVIDVGANVGVYSFSAAQKVGSTGRVFAIEPFSTCVQLLQQTCELNQLTQVTVCAGAASDRDGEAKLALHAASELNEIATDETGDRPTETIACFTLDSLIDTYQLQRVDWLKIDAERHEMQVLRGSDRLLRHFQPAILYENVVSSGESNLPVADYLRSSGYQLFRYQPFLKNLVPLSDPADFADSLNIIALPPANA
ncbi:MAG: FkbM family methyltransferase [Leptolyngbyaceae cyanobacterium SM1_3_5]|nr:FkbM family methyltransferase [Leptolyngbyaceae cyanobacterium SM1_3_5]